MVNTLTPAGVHKTLRRFFPAKNDDFECDYTEELAELHDFGITTEEQFTDLLQRRAVAVIEVDQSPMSKEETQYQSNCLGKDFVLRRLRSGYWFSYPALLRIALELEFGGAYSVYAQKRDRSLE